MGPCALCPRALATPAAGEHCLLGRLQGRPVGAAAGPQASPPPRLLGTPLLGTLTQACSDLPQGNMDQERLKKQQELAAAALYQQLQHQHFLQLVGRYGEPVGLLWAGQWSCMAHRLSPACLQPPAPAVYNAPGKGSYGGPDAAAAAAAHYVPAAAPGSQNPQVCCTQPWAVSEVVCVRKCKYGSWCEIEEGGRL